MGSFLIEEFIRLGVDFLLIGHMFKLVDLKRQMRSLINFEEDHYGTRD